MTNGTEYNIVKTLGEGAYGQVILVEKRENPNKKIALKKIVPKDERTLEMINSEVLVLQALKKVGRHQNVIKMFGMKTDNIKYCISMEYVDGGELFRKISAEMSLAKVKFYFRQLVDGLSFLHENGVVHRDIKPENLLLTKSDILKIADFGFATFYRKENGEEEMFTLQCGTNFFMAPELFTNNPYRGPPVDVWSAGVVLAEMLIGRLPWENATDASYPYLLWITNACDDDEPWKYMDEDTIIFLRTILTDDVEARATIQQVKDDPWLALEEEATPSLKRKAIETESSSNDQQVEKMAKRQRLETIQID
ncbi:hypothetical protein CAEBREN_02744 [Caenorhabditis brenneri]|uniref:non-specific serine/threonine protein kinase n=1 Tax=Caenorhabditis brenneri TaxID=135651 RepID=G0NWJ8_CAEBE|nr:hypothetical protein CAEBREN_02744 [Caenorhabditis brenneri]